MLVLAIFAVLVLLILLGVPIAVAMALTAVGFLLGLGQEQMLQVMAQRMFSPVTSYALLAIPFFLLAGNLMNTGGMTVRIFRFATALLGHIRGGLAHVSVFASMLFAGCTGAALAEAMGLGRVEIKAMEDGGFDRPFAAAVAAASSTIGPVIPPSIPLVIFGAMAEVSVGKLFLGGVVPGVMMGLALMAIIYFISRRRGYPREARAPMAAVLASFLAGLSGLLVPVIIMGGILGGIFTPTEAGVAGAVYALFVGLVLYREIGWRELVQIVWETIDQTVRVMFIIASAGLFGWLLIYLRAPDAVVAAMTGFASEPWQVLLLLNVVLLVLGCFMEGIAIMLLTIPIFMPLLAKFGISPLHFGVVMTLNLMVGLLTPPVGMALYAIATISDVPIAKLIKEVLPFVAAIVVVLLLITYIPALVTWLPGLVFGGGR